MLITTYALSCLVAAHLSIRQNQTKALMAF